MNWYIEALKKYATFTGRAQRAEFWYFILFSSIVSIVLTAFDAILGTLDIESGYGVLSAVYTLAIILPSIAVTTRRLHDINRSGWWQLLVLIPLVGAIVLIVWLATDSKEDNQYNEIPEDLSIKQQRTWGHPAIAIIAILISVVSITVAVQSQATAKENTTVQDNNLEDNLNGYKQCIIKKDYNKLSSFIHPLILEQFGGTVEFIKVMKSLPDILATKDMIQDMSKIRYGKIGHMEVNEDNYMSIIPTETPIKVRGIDGIIKSSIIAFSNNKGNSWYFFEVNDQSKNIIKYIAPIVSKRVHIPTPKLELENLTLIQKNGRWVKSQVIQKQDKPEIIVPDLESCNYYSSKFLEDMGLKSKEIIVFGPVDDDASEMGCPYRQSPRPGTKVPKGTVVTYRTWVEG